MLSNEVLKELRCPYFPPSVFSAFIHQEVLYMLPADEILKIDERVEEVIHVRIEAFLQLV